MSLKRTFLGIIMIYHKYYYYYQYKFSLSNHLPKEIHLISEMSEFIKKCDDDDHLITDVDDRISFNDDEDLEIIMTDDIDIEEKLEEIENLRMFTGIIIIIIITIINIIIPSSSSSSLSLPLLENYRSNFIRNLNIMEAELQARDNDKKKLCHLNNDLVKKLEDQKQVPLLSLLLLILLSSLLLDYTNEN